MCVLFKSIWKVEVCVYELILCLKYLLVLCIEPSDIGLLLVFKCHKRNKAYIEGNLQNISDFITCMFIKIRLGASCNLSGTWKQFDGAVTAFGYRCSFFSLLLTVIPCFLKYCKFLCLFKVLQQQWYRKNKCLHGLTKAWCHVVVFISEKLRNSYQYPQCRRHASPS